MGKNTRPIQFEDYLPEVFRADGKDGPGFLRVFLKAFEAVWEELQGAVGGLPDHESGGIPDLFHPATTPPAQFPSLPQEKFDYLQYLAGWVALPLRPEKGVDWNRRLFQAAIPLYKQRGTISGLEALLRAWLKDDLAENLPPSPPLLLVTDLCRTHTDIETIFQLAPEDFGGRRGNEIYAQVGVTTELGEGPPFFFLVDLLTSEKPPDLRNPSGLDVLQRAARFLLDNEKPAHTYYRLRVRVPTMQLAPEEPAPEEGFPKAYARVGVTTLLWGTPWIFDGHG
jgi:phage tail-like protein